MSDTCKDHGTAGSRFPHNVVPVQPSDLLLCIAESLALQHDQSDPAGELLALLGVKETL